MCESNSRAWCETGLTQCSSDINQLCVSISFWFYKNSLLLRYRKPICTFKLKNKCLHRPAFVSFSSVLELWESQYLCIKMFLISYCVNSSFPSPLDCLVAILVWWRMMKTNEYFRKPWARLQMLFPIIKTADAGLIQNQFSVLPCRTGNRFHSK